MKPPVRDLTPLLALLCACGHAADSEPVADVFAALGEIVPRASALERESFERGREVAMRHFTPEQGLGPTFNVSSCASCHEKPVVGGGAGRYRDFLLEGAPQPDGSFVSLGKNGVQNQYAVGPAQRVATPPEVTHSATRNPIPFFGVGLLAQIDEAEILRRADPDDRDRDGVSGRPNYDRGYVGRFGVKCQTVSIEKFIRGPLFNHLGLTTDPLPDELKARLPVNSAAQGGSTSASLWSLVGGVAHAQVAAPDAPTTDMDGVPDPELSADDLFDLVSFTMLLAPPVPDAPTAQSTRGRARFEELGCTSCHAPALRGPDGLVPAYTDLLIHDMGPELADGIPMGEATGSEFRTAPLWGVSATGPYLHDGRADTLDAAIRAHGGEGERARAAYAAASEAARADLLAFLDSLGGRAAATPGLIAPGSAEPAEDALGGPLAALSDDARAAFTRGRALFDRDTPLSVGLGPRFNGDSCRACHFQGAVGGAGPSDVDVLRQGCLDADGAFMMPPGGTIVPLHALDGVRPQPHVDAAFFERRETPALFGLGLIEGIAESAIVARADEHDADGDGIRGVAHVLDDGRVGRFGWKAQIPTLREFVHDALGNELGVTTPREPGIAFGTSADDDDTADPELSRGDLDDLTQFVSLLAPPPPSPHDARAEERGRVRFAALGCATCHVPALPGADGTDVPLYSDLLLHDVAGPDYVGIGDGNAAPRTLRTPPLWGLALSPPYLHDGSASSVEGAIAAHASEAEAARQRYEALAADARAELLAFLAAL